MGKKQRAPPKKVCLCINKIIGPFIICGRDYRTHFSPMLFGCGFVFFTSFLVQKCFIFKPYLISHKSHTFPRLSCELQIPIQSRIKMKNYSQPLFSPYGCFLLYLWNCWIFHLSPVNEVTCKM